MIASPQAYDFAFLFIELLTVPINPFLQPVLIPLNGDAPTWCISFSSQLSSLYQLPWVNSDPSCGSVMKSFKKVARIPNPWFHHCWPIFNWTTWHFLQAFTFVSSASFKFIFLLQISSDWLWKFFGKNCQLFQHRLPSVVTAPSYLIKLGNNISTKPNWLWKGECSLTTKQTPRDRKTRTQYILKKRWIGRAAHPFSIVFCIYLKWKQLFLLYSYSKLYFHLKLYKKSKKCSFINTRTIFQSQRYCFKKDSWLKKMWGVEYHYMLQLLLR